MEVIYILIPFSLFLVLIAVIGYIWAIHTGQYSDCDTPPLRMLTDDEQINVPEDPTKKTETK